MLSSIMMKKRRISPVVIVGLLFTGLCLFFLILQPSFIKDIDKKTYDAFMRVAAKETKSGAVVIVDIDDASLANPEYGQWPWPRYIIEELTGKIIGAGAKVTAFDVIFSERDRTSPVVIEETLKRKFGVDTSLKDLSEKYRDFDKLFADSLNRDNCILGCFMVFSQEPLREIDTNLDRHYSSRILVKAAKGILPDELIIANITAAGDILLPIPILGEKANIAFLNADPDPDGIIRNNPLVWAYGTRLYPSLALEALRLYTDPSKKILIEMSAELGVEKIRVGEYVVPSDESGKFVVYYRQEKKDVDTLGFVTTFPNYSAQDVLSGKVADNELEGKIVLVGSSATALKDIKATPLSQYFSGVEVHATIIDNILSGDMLVNPGWMEGVNAVLIILTGLFLTFFIEKGRSWVSFLVSALIITASFGASFVALTIFRCVYVPVWIILTVLMIYPVLTMIKYWEEERQKKRVREMFGTMVSKDVLRYLEMHPGSFSLTGQKVEATMFFSDVAGFTTISESLEPGKLSELLNKYFTPMTHIIMDRRGYVDKFQGDAVMAVWGVPFPMKDHAVQACLAAVEQQKKMAEIAPVLKEQYGHEIKVRMGLNSGIVTAGNMGSNLKFQYTVMGDAVNQAARYEPVNKDYGTTIVIGESTYNEAKDEIVARLLDKLVVKGKSVPINIYELVGIKGQVEGIKPKVIAHYEKALKLHWERNWDAALVELDKALALDPEDGPSANMRERVAFYIETPPGAGWKGEYIRKSKD